MAGKNKKIALTVRIEEDEARVYSAILALIGQSQNEDLRQHILDFNRENRGLLVKASDNLSKTQ